MRLLHTSDWHLGQKFLNQQNREAEENAALDWLLDLVRREQVEALILAGDVFDVNNPPVNAEKQYYNFLNRLKTTTGCRHVVITGGNHDSPFKLNAPRDLLRAFHIHVIGAATPSGDGLRDEVVELRDAEGRLEAIVAAVPFLRERDVAVTVPGESVEQRLQRLRDGIRGHFEDLATLISNFQFPVSNARPPVVATAHLFATGASAAEEQRNIYLGSQDHIRADEFPALFDYVALGHIHRAQPVGGKDQVRYSGSLIPLSFSEAADRKAVLLVDLEPGHGLTAVREVPVPVFRRLLNINGDLAAVEEQLRAAHRPEDPLPAWVKVVLEGSDLPANADQHLREAARDLHLDILRIEIAHRRTALDEAAVLTESLSDMSVQEVFLRRCQSEGLSEEATAELSAAFQELQEWFHQNADKIR